MWVCVGSASSAVISVFFNLMQPKKIQGFPAPFKREGIPLKQRRVSATQTAQELPHPKLQVIILLVGCPAMSIFLYM